MSDIMLHGVLLMPPELWQDTPLDKAQRHDRYVEASHRITALEAERDALRADAKRCDYIRRNPYRAWDLLSAAIDVNRPALWREQFNTTIDAALGKGGDDDAA